MTRRTAKHTSTQSHRDIGIDVTPPKNTCEDQKCPFHGTLSVRGQILDGVVDSVGMQNTVVVRKERFRFVKKYERYEKRTSRYSAHNPPCINARLGNKVRIMECRLLNKTVAFTIVEVMK